MLAENYQRWLRYGLCSLLLLTIIGTLGWFLLGKDLPVRVVRIEGAFVHVSRANLRAELLPLVQKGIFVVDVNAIQQRLLDMPWIAKASVRRIWPNTLSIHIVEQVPVARWNRHLLLNADGRVFAQFSQTDGTEASFNSLPDFIGPKGLQTKNADAVSAYDCCCG